MYFSVISRKKLLIITSIITALVLICLIFGSFNIQSAFIKKTQRLLPIYRVQTEEKKLAISFDCAWGVDYTDKLLEIMKEEDVKCTFFAVEFWVKKYPEYVKKISEYGHEWGTHSSTHPYMSKLDKNSIINELSTSIKAIEILTNKKVQVFRPPYGDYNNLLIETANEMGLYTIQWDVDSLDWKDLSANDIKKRVLNKVQNGSIVLFHNQGLHTAEALRPIIKELKGKGYEFVSIGELIYKDDYHIKSDGTQVKNN